MADNQEEVVYSFEGDTSSLREATQQAINLLDKYDYAIKKVATSDAFKASKTSATSFHKVIGGLVKQVNSLTTILNSCGNAVETAMPESTATVMSTVESLSDVLDYLDQSTTITSKDLQFLSTVLRESKSEMDIVASKASLLTTSLQPLERLHIDRTLNTSSEAAKAVQKHFQEAAASGFRVQEAYKASGKSAVDSAIAYLQAARAGTRMSSVQSIMQRLRIDMNLFGAYASKSWKAFSSYISPVTTKLQSFKSRAAKSLGKVRSIVAQVSSAFRRVSTEADHSSKAFRAFSSIATNLGKTFKNLNSNTGKNIAGFSNLTRVTRGLKAVITGLVGVNIAQWLSEAAKQSISYAENLNLFTVAMGDSLDVGTRFINQMSEIYGMDPSNLMRYAGNFYQLADAIDMPSEASAKLSLSLVKATNDISSLFNVPIETVFNDLSAGMQGMSRAVRKYGMDIRTTTLQQTALSLGILENVENMSEANRQGLRFITMMRQASNASGDFARTIESPANQLKIFKEQISQLGRAIGNLFIGPLATAIQYINGFVMALRMVISFVGSIFGLVSKVTGSSVDSTDKIAESIDNIGASAGGAAKELKNMLAPFDELNVLSQPDTSGGGGGGGGLDSSELLDPSIAEAISNMELRLENIRMKALEVRDAILKFFGFKIDGNAIISWDAEAFEANLIGKFPKWTKTIQAVFDNWSSIVKAFGDVLKALGDIAQSVWNKVVGFISKFINDDTVSTFISGLAETIDSFANFLSANTDTIANFAIALGVLSVAFRGFSNISSLIAPVTAFVSTCASAIAPFAAVIGVATAIVATIGVLYANSSSFATAFNTLVASVGNGLLEVFGAFIEALQAIWAGIQTLWSNNIQPMLGSIGDAIAPVVETIIVLWTDLVAIIVDAFDMVAGLWSSVLQPVLAAFFDAISKLAEIFGTLWSEVVKPVSEHIGEGIQTLWENTLRPIFENIIAIIGSVMEIILTLWNSVLAPVVNWLSSVLAPIFVNVFNTIWSVVQTVVGGIGQSINGLLEILRGVLDFIAGVFTGDWSRAWKGIVGIFKGIWDTMVGVVKSVFNAVIGVINAVLGAISGAINSIIRAVNRISFRAPDWIPGVGGKTLGFNIGEVGAWSVPYLANGGVVTSPTVAMIGEGKYDEAVVPLGNSPQMRELVSQIAEATKRGESDIAHVSVYIGNELVAEYYQKAERRRQLQTNGGN